MSTRGGRGRGGKFSKPKRGGGKHFSRDLQPINADGEIDNMWAPRNRKADDDDSDDDEEEDSDEDSDEDDSDDDAKKPDTANMTREERKAAARARKIAAIKRKGGRPAVGDLPPSDEDGDEDEEDEDDSDDADMPANPNHTAAARVQAKTPVQPANDDDAGAAAGTKKGAAGGKKGAVELSRKEKEALAAQQARERYEKLHAEGKTDEARADLARLKLVRERREAEAARKKVEAEERAEQEKAKTEQLAREERMRKAAAGKPAKKKK